MGIDRDQIVKNFYPAGSTVADYFTPCEIPFACKGDKSWAFDPAAAKALLTEAGLDPASLKFDINFRAAVRGYNPNPPVIATEIAQQLKKNLGVERDAEASRVGRHDRRLHAGHPEGSQPHRLGR